MKHILPILFLFFNCGLIAQTTAPEVISSGGDSFKKLNASMDWTLGEVAIDTYKQNNVTLTQGFQQGDYIIEKILNKLSDETLSVQLFPNPTSDFLKIKINSQKQENYLLTIIDNNGRIILNDKLQENSATLDFSTFTSGTYYVQLIDNETILANYKILKVK